MSPDFTSQTPDTGQLQASYESFDCIMRIPLSSSDMVGTKKGLSVLDHEELHFFQNFFTTVGLSQYFIIHLMNVLIDELLSLYPQRIKVPLVRWIPTTPEYRTNDRVFVLYDRLLKLGHQLTSSRISQIQMEHARKSTLRSVNIANSIGRQGLALDLQTRSLRVDGRSIFTVDLSSIFEAMAFAQEHQAGAIRAAGISPSEKAGDLGARKIREELAYSLEDSLNDPSLLNYTFPILMLLQSGYMYDEAVTIVGLLAFLALMTQFAVPSLPEYGVQQDIKFGTVCTDVFIRLLGGMCDESLLSTFNRCGSSKNYSFRHFGDDLLNAVGAPDLTGSIEFFKGVTTPTFFGHGDLDNPANCWVKRIFEAANGFHESLSQLPSDDGAMFVMNPLRYLTRSGLCSIVYCKGEFVYTGKIDEEIKQQLNAFHLGMTYRKQVAFCDLDSIPGSEMSDTLARTMFEAMKASLRQSYGIEIIEPFHA